MTNIIYTVAVFPGRGTCNGAIMTNVVTASGARVAYRVQGQGPAVVMVNGTAALDVHWGTVIDQLSEIRTVISLDYSGSGETTDNGRALSLKILTDQVAAVANAAGVATFDVVGHSLGAAVATSLSVDMPGSVRSLRSDCRISLGW